MLIFQEKGANFMNKMSGMGFAIVIVILIGLGMIISAPTLLDNSSDKENANSEKFQAEDLSTKLQNFENKINERLNNMEMNYRNSQANNNQYVTNKYICEIQGYVDENGNVIKPDSRNGLSKFVFVCEYKP